MKTIVLILSVLVISVTSFSQQTKVELLKEKITLDAGKDSIPIRDFSYSSKIIRVDDLNYILRVYHEGDVFIGIRIPDTRGLKTYGLIRVNASSECLYLKLPEKLSPIGEGEWHYDHKKPETDSLKIRAQEVSKFHLRKVLGYYKIK
jgi:hypothetical protein